MKKNKQQTFQIQNLRYRYCDDDDVNRARDVTVVSMATASDSFWVGKVDFLKKGIGFDVSAFSERKRKGNLIQQNK